MDATPLFDPITIGKIALNHRVVLAPMTRIRADEATLAPTDLTALYYAQRASEGGLLITEAVHISPEATPVWSIYPRVAEVGGHVPGIWTDVQTQAWKEVVAGVHAKGGKIFCQLLHTGRVAQPEIGQHPLVTGTGAPLPPVSSSTTAIEATSEEGNQYNWNKAAIPPRALSEDNIQRVIGDYARAAQNARVAGFDGVELHAAHGYLIEQFLNNGVNNRTDRYGGSIENRCNLLFEVVQSLIDVMGEGRVGVRLSPTHIDPQTGKSQQVYFGVRDSDPVSLYSVAIECLNTFPLAYLMLTEPRVGGLGDHVEEERAYQHPLANSRYRSLYKGTLIGAGGFTPTTAAQAVRDGAYDLIAFGRWFLSNPDLPERLRLGTPLNVYERSTFYGAGAEGYTDYPTRTGPKGRFRLMEPAQIGTSLATSRKTIQ
ncbi:N-ethylmaleimide reductase [Roseovarius albus]|uniref:N-ethylmaleimide reductase n=1 Tax=Roseovarius albus TaxID=1247867 RepID=A0A1X6YRU9_9RHOB|nr:alkene reductase [Roseovarius albus]SLN29418.1 N-ethylmaleimide reductase [Roseovarius albus]